MLCVCNETIQTIQVEAEKIVQQLQQMLSKRLSNTALSSEEVGNHKPSELLTVSTVLILVLLSQYCHIDLRDGDAALPAGSVQRRPAPAIP